MESLERQIGLMIKTKTTEGPHVLYGAGQSWSSAHSIFSIRHLHRSFQPHKLHTGSKKIEVLVRLVSLHTGCQRRDSVPLLDAVYEHEYESDIGD